MNKGYTYITTNKNKTVLYIGATNDIIRRMNEHKNKTFKNSFSAKYNCYMLVYFEELDSVKKAFEREKQLKAGNRKRKERLINSINPDWEDLSIDWIDQNLELRELKNKI
ncbi:GIY-YIG nuclease family protein [uncultured Aquimarina sp.]|uniref:GIY-YIG nuclease family protein n=1 Tax=uncultured Aquimarina sp. TaxID=575652 RepID=UPI00260C3C68|nr:GIY-YIG nuclease family protein [uncultured Aquimarina sp.]